MRKLLPNLLSLVLILISHPSFGQAPNLGAASGFVFFTAAGAFSNDGSTLVTGDIGTNVGAFTGFPPGTVIGQIHVADAISAQAAGDVDDAFGELSTVTCGQVIGTTLGNGQILTPDVYCLGGASVINGDLILDGECDPDAFFIIKINGALSTNSQSRVILRNGASLCNVYWQINGAVELGPGSSMIGTIVANGAIELLDGASLSGRALTRQGAIALHNNFADINMQPTASVITAGGPTTFCAGGSVTLSGNCGGVWSNGATTASITVTTSGNYSVTNSDNCGSATSNNIIVTVRPLPVCTITGNLSICTGQSTQLCAPAGAASYLWSTGGTSNCITVSTAGAYSVTVTSSAGCSSICSTTVISNPSPVCTITGNLSICAGQSTQLCAPAGAASYTWSNGGTSNCVTVSTGGLYSVTATSAAGCSSVCSVTVLVNPQPVCTITGNLSICTGQSTQLCVPAGAASYLWSTGGTSNCVTVSAAGAYSVTVTSAAGCSSVCSATVLLNPMPVCTITGNLSICLGQSTQLCVPAGAASYLWSNGGTSNCNTVSSAGIYSVTVTSAAGCSSVCSATVLVNPQPVCTITGNLSICAGQTSQLCVPAGAASYLWSNGGTSNCVTVSAGGAYSVTVTNASGCSSVCSATVLMNPMPVCTITGNLSICAGQSTQLCVPAGAASYLWSNGGTSNCVTVSSAGLYSVTVTSAAGCSSVCSATVLVSPQPVCTISGNLSICLGQSTQLCVPAGAASYLWSNGGTSNCVTVSAGGAYSVTVTNASGCSSVCSATVLLNPMPVCTITGNLSICAGQSTQLCVPAGAASYLWSNGGTSNCVTVSSAGLYTVTVTSAAGCSSVCSATVLVSPQPVCTISGNLSICLGQSTQLCVPAGAASYLWSNGGTSNCVTVSAAGAYSVTVTSAAGCSSVCSALVVVNPLPVCTITGNNFICNEGQTTQLCVPAGAASYLWSTGANTNCITVGAGTYSVTITSTSGCSSICSETVTINPQPVCTITGDNFICAAGQTTQLCVPAGAVAYLWSTGASTNCITVGTAGLYSVTVTNAGGCSSICSVTVTVNPQPVCTITGNNNICEGQSTQLCVPPGAASYLWSTGAITNCISVAAAGTYFVTVTSTSGCSSICSATVVLNPLPNCTITGDNFICEEGQSAQLCVPPGAASYLWSNGAVTNCISVSTAGIYFVTVTNSSGCSSICSQTVTLTPQAVCTITGDNFICIPGQTTQLCVPPGAASYLWSTGANTNCITVNAAGTYTVTVTYANGCSSICSETVIVNPQPNCTITGNDFICGPGQTTQLCVPPGAASYLWSTGAITNCITVNAAGTYSVTVTNQNGCSSICSETVTAGPLPVCTITGNDFICAPGQTTELCVPAGAASYLWSTGATTNCISVGTGTYSVTVTDANGCSSICNKTVVVNPQPSCTITGDRFICEPGQTTQLCVPAGAVSYLWSNGSITNCITVSTGTYSVTVTYASGCTSVCSETVVFNPQSSCIITGDEIICTGQSTLLCVLPGAAFYLWSTGAVTNCITVTEAGTYSVTVTNANGCTSVCSKTITLSPLPACIITGDDFICEEGQLAQLCVPAGAISYLWSTGATTNCIIASAAGTYSVTVTNANGCTSICSKTIIINPQPTCTITGNGFICETGQLTQLCVAASATATYLWSTGATTNCISAGVGTYFVTVTTASGCTSVCSKTVAIDSVSTCEIICDDLICEGDSTVLCAPPGAASYWWSTGAMTPCITVGTAGTYSVTVTYAGGCSSVCSKIITVSPAPNCTITGNCNLVCGGQPTLLCAPAGCAQYLWCTGATTSCIQVTTAGTYCVTVTNAAGCSSVCCITVTGGVVPDCEITGNCTLPCSGQPTLLCAPPGCASYWWNTGATTSCISVNTPGNYCVTVTYANGCSSVCSRIVTGSTFNCEITGNCSLPCNGQPTLLCAPPGCTSYWWSTGATTSCISVNTPGFYCVTVTNANGCTSVCSSTVTAGSSFNCEITGNCVLPCSGQPTLLCAPPGCTSYWWNTGATTSCISVNTPGFYCVTVTNANGCTSVCSSTVTAGSSFNCEITGNCTLPCNGQPTLLCAPSGAVSYLWSTGATTSCIIAGLPGIYSVTITNANGCTSTGSAIVIQQYVPLCTISGDSTICAGEPTLLCAPTGFVAYHWSNGATTSCIIAGLPGIYSLTATSASGCSKTDSITVTESEEPVCEITGVLNPDQGESTTLCAPEGMGAYLWNTGDTTRCITVDTSGAYWVMVTSTKGCSSICNTNVVSSVTDNSDWDILPFDYGNLVVQVYPNPFSALTTIEFQNTTSDSHVRVELCKLTGTTIATLFDRDIEQSKPYKTELSSENLAEGVYICRIVNGDQIINKKIILIR